MRVHQIPTLDVGKIRVGHIRVILMLKLMMSANVQVWNEHVIKGSVFVRTVGILALAAKLRAWWVLGVGLLSEFLEVYGP